jgi:LDH2 family malate/lactate/ureidoglycolate dehydrogenase
VDHTGRLGAFAERAAQRGCLAVMFGGGARKTAPQVAPYGGARGILPTNPFAFGIPGGDRGPVTIDFATSSAAGGKIYAARESGRQLAEGLCIDARGRPTTNPDDYFNGGALLPMAGPKGYGMALMAELLGEAIMGDAMWGGHWICICVEMSRFRAPLAYREAAEECLAELRNCPPAPGFSRVEIPGEREAQMRADRLVHGVPIPAATLDGMCALGTRLQVDVGELQAAHEIAGA